MLVYAFCHAKFGFQLEGGMVISFIFAENQFAFLTLDCPFLSSIRSKHLTVKSTYTSCQCPGFQKRDDNFFVCFFKIGPYPKETKPFKQDAGKMHAHLRLVLTFSHA